VASNDNWLALDQGGHASRAIVFGADGRRIDEAFAPIATRRSADGMRVEHDPEELVASLGSAIALVCTAGRRIAASGLATQRSSMVCWDRRTGRALSPVISWQDRRNAVWLASLEPRRAWIRERTGLVLSPHYGASKMRWCLDELPAVRAAAESGDLAMGPLSAFLAARLTGGAIVADPANASRTQLWDPRTRDWSDELLALFGVPRAALPACVTSRHAYGDLATPAGPVPLAVVTGDQSAVPFAFGALDPSAAYVNVGTGAFAQRALRDRLPDAPRLLASVAWSDGTGCDYTLEGTVNGAGSALEWLAAQRGIDVGRALQALSDAIVLPEPPLFLNGVAGLGSPFWKSDFESRFIGDGSPQALVLAVLESIAFLVRVNLDELAEHGPAFTRIVLTGGFASGDLFCRLLADATRIPVWRSLEPEATARGLAWLVAGRPPHWVPAAGGLVMPRENAIQAERFGRWRSAMVNSTAGRAC
jgi:glycerol kinase